MNTRDMFSGRELAYVKLIGAGAAPMTPNEFLNAASKRSLCVKNLARPPPDAQAQEGRFRMLALDDRITVVKVEHKVRIRIKFA